MIKFLGHRILLFGCICVKYRSIMPHLQQELSALEFFLVYNSGVTCSSLKFKEDVLFFTTRKGKTPEVEPICEG